MDKSAQRIRADHTEQPEDQEHDGYSPEHLALLSRKGVTLPVDQKPKWSLGVAVNSRYPVKSLFAVGCGFTQLPLQETSEPKATACARDSGTRGDRIQ